MTLVARTRSVTAPVLPLATALVRRDLRNILTYGADVPSWCQRIWVDPGAAKQHIAGFGEEFSARIVMGMGRDRRTAAFTLKTSSAREQSIDGSWEETGPWTGSLRTSSST